MPDDSPRSRVARVAAEAALVRVVHHYADRPEFVVLGGLVPELFCSTSEYTHAGTTDVDVQVNLEIAVGSVGTARLEAALRNAEFVPDAERAWRWTAEGPGAGVVVRFELLADLDDQPEGVTVTFDECEDLGAANLRGTGYAARDVDIRQVTSRIGGVVHTVEVNMSGLAGFLLAKIAAAYSRRKPKDWYDISFVLLHNDAGGPEQAAAVVMDRFGGEINGSIRTAIEDLNANFAKPTA
ncbi:MAG: hypothetical protein GEU79_16545, partial [Acidimicrobiia bacterium]|nr:hypothetical protein [Acidimicrobiia bacterium]